MSIVGWILAAGLASAAPHTDAGPPPVESAEGGTLNGGGARNGKKKKKKKKKTKKKKGGKKNKGGSSRIWAPWGKSNVLVWGGAGLAHGLTREAPETGEEMEDDAEGSSASSCTGDDCTAANSETNAASGWGQSFSVGVALPGLGGSHHSVAPTLQFTQHNFTLDGLDHLRPEDPSDTSVHTTYVVDRADYAMSINSVKLGFLLASKVSARSSWFIMGGIDLGFAWGTVETTLDSSPNQVTTGDLSGFALGMDFGVGYSFGKHAHLLLLPVGEIDFMDLRTDNDAAFPFLEDDKAMTTAWGPTVKLLAAF